MSTSEQFNMENAAWVVPLYITGFNVHHSLIVLFITFIAWLSSQSLTVASTEDCSSLIVFFPQSFKFLRLHLPAF